MCDGRDDCGNNEDELPENCLANEDLAVEDGRDSSVGVLSASRFIHVLRKVKARQGTHTHPSASLANL